MYYDILDSKMSRPYKRAKNKKGSKNGNLLDESDSDENKPLFLIEKDPNAVMNKNALKNVQPSQFIQQDTEVKELAFEQWKKGHSAKNSLKSQYNNSDSLGAHSFLKNMQGDNQSMSSGSSLNNNQMGFLNKLTAKADEVHENKK